MQNFLIEIGPDLGAGGVSGEIGAALSWGWERPLFYHVVHAQPN